MIRLLPLAVVAGCTLAGIVLGFAWGALFRRAPRTWTSRTARRIAGHRGAPDLSTTLAPRIADADRIASALAADFDAVDQHFATAAAILQPDRDPDQDRIDAVARVLLAGVDVPVIPGTDLRTPGEQS